MSTKNKTKETEEGIELVMICARCGYIGQKVRFSKGSYLWEMFLWLLLFVPGAIYTTWRAFNEYQACPICQNKEMTPLNTPFGKQIQAEKARLSQPIPALDLFDVISKILRL